MKVLMTVTVLLFAFFYSAAEGQNIVRVAAAPQTKVSTFSNPRYEGYRLDWWLDWGKNCGPQAAQAFCQQHQYTLAIDWTIAEYIGATSPTKVIGSGEVCGQDFCSGFSSITCKFIEQKPTSSSGDEGEGSGSADSFRPLLKLVIERTANGRCRLVETQLTSKVFAGPFYGSAEAQEHLQNLKNAGECAR